MAEAGITRRAAVPAYIGNDFREAAPGHCFYLYLRLWGPEWKKVKEVPEQREVHLGEDDRRRAAALVERQRALANRRAALDPDAVLSLPAKSTAPFTTGLGMEHPLENGFAFLTPYGLPILPGSSVKGVLLQAARELDARGDFEDPDRVWERQDIEYLFGSAGPEDSAEYQTPRRRGALTFHDVFPALSSRANLEWEIMTPHQGPYYQDRSGGTSPHDNASPVPIHFLTVPAGSGFRFTITCNRALLGESGLVEKDAEGIPRWQHVVRSLLDHAFNWLGFGAKTAVGYGAMDWDHNALHKEEEERARQREEQQRQAELAELPPGERLAEEMLADKKNPSDPDHRHLLQKLEGSEVEETDQQPVAEAALQRLEVRRQEVRKLKPKQRERQEPKLDDEERRLRAFLPET